MGTHPNAPSTVLTDAQLIPLPDWIDRFPNAILGRTVVGKFGKQLPYLFKVLSAAEPLSIQAHPNQKQAKELHNRDPKHYPDANHKPEIAIALTRLEVLIGFRPFRELQQMLKTYPEIADFIEFKLSAAKSETNQPTTLRKWYQHYVERAVAQPEHFLAALNVLSRRLGQIQRLSPIEKLYLQLRRSYPGPDIGLLSIFMLNHKILQKGQALFIASGVPHAYLSGDIIECMANSDNVVRAGLTPKYQDINTLIEILDYSNRNDPIICTQSEGPETIYKTPTAEYELRKLELSRGNLFQIHTDRQVQVFIITAGRGQIHWNGNRFPCTQGQSYLIPALLSEYKIQTSSQMTLYRVIIPSDCS
jgi:mannose-6-phosphate isomerase